MHLVPLISTTIDIPLVKRKSAAKKEEESRDLKRLLSKIKVEGIISGAVASEYQRTRFECMCHDLGIKSFTPLWHKDQGMLLKEMIDSGFKAIITAVAAEGFDESWLGREIDDECYQDLIKLHHRYKINIVGEGGEFETLVVDAPIYKKRILIEEMEKEWKRDSGMLKIKRARLVNKNK
jgi:predicted ATP pyrophosphatase (TIGR00289 family)